MNRKLRRKIIKRILLFLMDAVPRALRTFFQTFASGMTIGAVMSEIDWRYIASAAAVSAVYSLAMSLAGTPEGKLRQENRELREWIPFTPSEDEEESEV